MSGKAEKRQAHEAAKQAEIQRAQLAEQERLSKEKSDREKMKAQRLLMRSLRAGAGGFFETDTESTLGGSGTLS